MSIMKDMESVRYSWERDVVAANENTDRLEGYFEAEDWFFDYSKFMLKKKKEKRYTD